MSRLLTSIAVLLFVIGGAMLLGGGEVLHLGEEVASQVHSTVDWSDPESVALARYNEAFAVTLEPLARIYEAATTPGAAIDAAPARAALARAQDMAAVAAQDAPETLASVAPTFHDYLDKAGALVDAWNPARLPTALLAETFEAQHAVNDALQDAEEARLLRDLRANETERGYGYHHRLIHYEGYRATRAATGTMVTAGDLRRALADYRAAEVTLQQFLEGRSRIHDDFLPFSEAAAALGKAMSTLVDGIGDAPADQWVPDLDSGGVANAFAELRAQRRRLLRLERTGEL